MPAQTHTRSLLLATQTGLRDHVSGVDILWSERIGYTGSDPESDFRQREGHYKPNGTKWKGYKILSRVLIVFFSFA